MKIALTGATGFLGKELAVQLRKKTTDIIQIGRNIDNIDNVDYVYVSGIDSSSLFDFGTYKYSVLIHCAARVHMINDSSSDALEEFREVNTYGTLNLAQQAAKAGVKRFIFISSIKVSGESTKLDYPFKADDTYVPIDPYGLSKYEAEIGLHKIAKETGMEVVIIRPTLVYGPDVKANFASLMNLVSMGIPLPFGSITSNKRSLVSINNLVDLIITCIDHPKAANQVFLVSDDHDVSTSEMVREMAKSLNKPQWQLPIPKWCYRLVGSIFGKQDVVDRLLGSLQVDITHTKETLDWKPPQTLKEGFKETAEAFLLNKENKQ